MNASPFRPASPPASGATPNKGLRAGWRVGAGLLLGGLGLALLAGCERPPVQTTQTGYRGTGIVEVDNPRTQKALLAANVAPAALPPAPAVGPKASQVYRNVKVLGDLSVTEFTRTMQALTNWVSPEQGCNYCHVPGDFASDDIYTKVVSRRMVEMTRHVNADWTSHVSQTGVTCYTCHRGNPVPQAIWFGDPVVREARGLSRGKAGQNTPLPVVGLTSLPHDLLGRYLSKAEPIRVVAKQALPVERIGHSSTQATEATYGLMFHMSESLGVNCTYCHNSRSFINWEQPARISAYHGIRMVRDLNNSYLDPLKPAYPALRLGPLGEAPKANCLTCHQGLNKPLNGEAMAAAYPALQGTPAVAAPK